MSTEVIGFIDTRDRTRRRALGVFYTPEWLADILVEWALSESDGPILDPSYGGCSFLQAAYNLLARRNVPKPGRKLFGVDVDRCAQHSTEALKLLGMPDSHFMRADFLNNDTHSRLGQFSCVVGNPPFVRHHNMSYTSIERAQDLVKNIGVRLPRMSSAWSYFTVVAAAHVKDGGRLALILSSSILSAHYAQPLLTYLGRCFGHVRMVHLEERVFKGTDEEITILLCSGKNKTTTNIEYVRVKRADDLHCAVHRGDSTAILTSDIDHKLSVLPSRVVSAWQELKEIISPVALGDVARVRIGVVTGANEFFIRPHSDPIFRFNTVTGIPIVTRKRMLKKPILEIGDLRRLERDGMVTRLAVIADDGRIGRELRRQIRAAERGGIAARHHCSRRSPWYCVLDYAAPDIFLPYLCAAPPTLVSNRAKATCTNSIHRVWVEKPEMIDSLVLSSYSSLFAFESELYGRHYGGGVLKLEPSAATRLSVVTQGGMLSNAFLAADSQADRSRMANKVLSRGKPRATGLLELLAVGALELTHSRFRSRGLRSAEHV